MQEYLMKVRSLYFGAAALVAVAIAPSQASAQCGTATYAATLGIGGTLSGCFGATIAELGENAGGIASQFYWNGDFTGNTNASPSNAPLVPGTQFFNDDCGSNGTPGFVNFRWCGATPGTAGPSVSFTNLSGELVFGLNAVDQVVPQQNGGNNYWIYSGAESRNGYPAPQGFQEVLYQLTTNGVVDQGQFLFAWEDINSACIGLAGSAQHPSLTDFRTEDLNNAQVLDDPNNCNSFNPGSTASDNDFNDSYILLNIAGTRLDTVTPEPMTMSLMAMGLVGLGGASLRRRKKNS
jgi:hypothetical protein